MQLLTKTRTVLHNHKLKKNSRKVVCSRIQWTKVLIYRFFSSFFFCFLEQLSKHSFSFSEIRFQVHRSNNESLSKKIVVKLINSNRLLH